VFASRTPCWKSASITKVLRPRFSVVFLLAQIFGWCPNSTPQPPQNRLYNFLPNDPSLCDHYLLAMLPSEHKTRPNADPPPSCTLPTVHPVALPSSPPNAVTCYQPTFTRWTSGLESDACFVPSLIINVVPPPKSLLLYHRTICDCLGL
jgi:hypothetical protein